jgi:hypothetical protein
MKALGLFSFDQDALRGDRDGAFDDSPGGALDGGARLAPAGFADATAHTAASSSSSSPPPPAQASAPASAPSARPEDRYQGPQPAPTYFAVHRAKILQAIGARLTGASLPAPHPRLRWATTGASLAGAFESALLDAEGGVFNLAGKIPALLHPVDPWALIDAHRELSSGEPDEPHVDRLAVGSLEWNPVIGAALALEVEAQLRTSSQRMGVRYVAQAETVYGQVTVAMLVTSHPFDRIVARLLCAPGVVALGGARSAAGSAPASDARSTNAPSAFKGGLRLVSFEWLGARDPALWNWVRVVEPAEARVDARKEEVAMAVLERQDGELHTELAYGLTGSPPFFQIPPRWARDLEGARRHAPRSPAHGEDGGDGGVEGTLGAGQAEQQSWPSPNPRSPMR